MSDTPLTVEQIAAAKQRAVHEGYIHRVLVSFDDFWNVVTGGKPHMTISARAYLDSKKHEVLATVLNHALSDIQPSHGQLAAVGDVARDEASEAALQQAVEPPPK